MCAWDGTAVGVSTTASRVPEARRLTVGAPFVRPPAAMSDRSIEELGRECPTCAGVPVPTVLAARRARTEPAGGALVALGCHRALVAAVLFCLLLFAPPPSIAAFTCGAEADNGGADDGDTGPSCTGEPDSVTDDARPEASGGNPISLLTGNKYQREPDFSIPGSGLRFTRHYNSTNADFDPGPGSGVAFHLLGETHPDR